YMTTTTFPSVTGEGEDMLLRGPALRSPVATSFCQRTEPSLRLRQIKFRFLLASGLETKMWSPQMTGLEPEGPGNAAFQAIFSFVLQVAGRFSSSVEPR